MVHVASRIVLRVELEIPVAARSAPPCFSGAELQAASAFGESFLLHCKTRRCQPVQTRPDENEADPKADPAGYRNLASHWSFPLGPAVPSAVALVFLGHAHSGALFYRHEAPESQYLARH